MKKINLKVKKTFKPIIVDTSFVDKMMIGNNDKKFIAQANIAKAIIQYAADVCNGICKPKNILFFHRPKYKNREKKIKNIYSRK